MEKKSNLVLLNSQKASISQSLQYSLRILEMNNIQLREYIQNALIENPFLKEHEDNDEISSNVSIEFLENFAAKRSFKDELLSQTCFFHFNDDKKEIVEMLIDNIIDKRYLSSDVLIKISQEKNMSYFEILKIIEKLQTLSPYGFFSFNIKDKIKSVLVAENKYYGIYKTLMQNIDAVLDNGFSVLKNKYGFDDAEINLLKADIKNLNINFDANIDDNFYKIPDIIIENKTKNECESSINDYLLPRLSIDESLYKNVTEHHCSKNDIQYVKERIESAKLLIKSINYRKSTLLKIVKEIAYRQSDFFSGYSIDINPISVKSIANILMLHEGTVHRAIANKSVSTPCGIFDIKTLMPREIKTKISNKLVSNYSIKEYIKNLVDKEPKNKPYSDENIMYFLNAKGIIVSRRTVAKYRSMLNIPKVAHRVKFYKIVNASA